MHCARAIVRVAHRCRLVCWLLRYLEPLLLFVEEVDYRAGYNATHLLGHHRKEMPLAYDMLLEHNFWVRHTDTDNIDEASITTDFPLITTFSFPNIGAP